MDYIFIGNQEEFQQGRQFWKSCFSHQAIRNGTGGLFPFEYIPHLLPLSTYTPLHPSIHLHPTSSLHPPLSRHSRPLSSPSSSHCSVDTTPLLSCFGRTQPSPPDTNKEAQSSPPPTLRSTLSHSKPGRAQLCSSPWAVAGVVSLLLSWEEAQRAQRRETERKTVRRRRASTRIILFRLFLSDYLRFASSRGRCTPPPLEDVLKGRFYFEIQTSVETTRDQEGSVLRLDAVALRGQSPGEIQAQWAALPGAQAVVWSGKWNCNSWQISHICLFFRIKHQLWRGLAPEKLSKPQWLLFTGNLYTRYNVFYKYDVTFLPLNPHNCNTVSLRVHPTRLRTIMSVKWII